MSQPSHLVILVHGMNTRANWMTELRDTLEDAGFVVGLTSYGHFSPLKFLSPFRSFRQMAVNRVLTDIRTSLEVFEHKFGSKPDKMSVISHSFGTYVVARILEDAEDLKWDRVIFCGSVLREDFPLQKVISRFEEPLLNEIGTKDYWPALAESCGWGYGSVGSTGFNRPPVHTRWHSGLKHRDFLTTDFCKGYWIGFLRGEKPKRADKPKGMPLWVRVLAALPLRLLPVALSIAVLVLPLYLIVNLIVTSNNPKFALKTDVPIFAIEAGQKLDLGQPIAKGSPKAINSPYAFLEGRWIAKLDGGPEQALMVNETHDATFGNLGPAKFFVPNSYPPENLAFQTARLTCHYAAKMASTTTITMRWTRGSPQCPEEIYLARPG